jgi:acetyl-CoA carboxylase carboxyl transferase subunit alpha
MQSEPLGFEKPILELDGKVRRLTEFAAERDIDVTAEVAHLRQRQRQVIRGIFQGLSPWDRVALARHPERPQTCDYVEKMVSNFVELHGDRAMGDDGAILTGFGTLGSEKVLLIGSRKGRTTAERMACNFGMAHPEGYRKALVKMKLAEKFRLPVVTLVDTPGAFPGIGAEERGQANLIARNIYEMARLQTPIVVVVIGEGGSGGALGIGVGDRVLMLEHAYYSVITPEGCAAILWKDGAEAPRAAEALRLTSEDNLRLRVIDEIVPEPLGGAHRDPEQMARTLKEILLRNLAELRRLPLEQLVARRYETLRTYGNFVFEGDGEE